MSAGSPRLILRCLTGALFLAILGGATACGAMTTGGSQPIPSPSSTVVSTAVATQNASADGELSGQVLARGSCPVENPVSPCKLAPVAGASVSVRTAGGGVVASAPSDANGRFRIALPAGQYNVSATPGTPANASPSGPVAVVIQTGHTTSVQIVVSAGPPRS